MQLTQSSDWSPPPHGHYSKWLTQSREWPPPPHGHSSKNPYRFHPKCLRSVKPELSFWYYTQSQLTYQKTIWFLREPLTSSSGTAWGYWFPQSQSLYPVRFQGSWRIINSTISRPYKCKIFHNDLTWRIILTNALSDVIFACWFASYSTDWTLKALVCHNVGVYIWQCHFFAI